MAASGPEKTAFNRSVVGASVVLVVGGLIGGLLFRASVDGERAGSFPAVVSPVAVPGPAVAGPTVGAVGKPVAPSFDVVRVSPQGNVVIAGRGEPGAEVIVREGTNEVARATIDRRGEFVALPSAPLEPGGRELVLSSRAAGGPEVKADGSVLLSVPSAPPRVATGEKAAPVMAMLVPPLAPPRLLSPEAGSAAVGAAKGGVLGLDTVDYDDKGSIRFKGGAAAGSSVRVYVDNGAVGDGRADAAGRWSLAPGEAVGPGVHVLRIDQLDLAGKVARRVEVPFQRALLTVSEAGTAAVAGGRVIVQPGQSLWRLARVAYGRGVRYTVIYLANRNQIRDARRIYPGQVFSIPAP